MSDKPFRFYDNRQKYLAFVTTTNEKWKLSERAAGELDHLTPRPPAFRLFDAGMGDGTVLSNIMRALHQRHPHVPVYVVGKEISLEDLRLSLDKLPDRLVEHPASCIVMTNLFYAEAPWLRPNSGAEVNWTEVALTGDSSFGFAEQLRALDPTLVDNWQVKSSAKTGNPLYVTPSVLVIYREDHAFLLDDVIPKEGQAEADFDFVVASQPWRARTSAELKARTVISPLLRALAPGGRMMVAQSAGNDPGEEIITAIWGEEKLFPVDRYALVEAVRDELGDEVVDFDLEVPRGGDALISYQMHTLPEEVGPSIGTSTLFAAWNAATYVAQIDDARIEETHTGVRHLEITGDILRRYGGLWFNDEVFVFGRKR